VPAAAVIPSWRAFLYVAAVKKLVAVVASILSKSVRSIESPLYARASYRTWARTIALYVIHDVVRAIVLARDR